MGIFTIANKKLLSKNFEVTMTKLGPANLKNHSPHGGQLLRNVWPHLHWFDLIWGFAWGFPGGSDGKESACYVGDLDSIPGLGWSPGEGHGNPLQYSCLKNLMVRGAWQAAVPEVAKSHTTEWLGTAQQRLCLAVIAWHLVSI